jgi:mannose-6-phosphate isomerase-like protein (cupin superfamily)
VSARAVSPGRHYVHLGADGASTTVAGGEAFWSLPPAALEKFGQGWLVSEFDCAADWTMWEMHPQGDEFVYLLSGQVTLVLEIGALPQSIELTAPKAFVIPSGVWHTAKVRAPSRLLFVTRGAGTLHRSA